MKKLNSKYLLFYILLIGILNGCSMFTESSSSGVPSGDFINYKNVSYGIEIDYPNDWYRAEAKEKFSVSFFPENKYSKNNITIYVQDKNKYDNSETLEESIEKLHKRSDLNKEAFKMTKEEIIITNMPATKTIVTIDHTININWDSPLAWTFLPFAVLLDNADYTEKIMQITIKGNDKVYLITYYAKIYSKNPDGFNVYLDIANKMINSFEIIN